MTSDPEDAAVRSTLGSYRLLGELGRDPLGVLHLACPAGVRTFPKWAVVRRMHSGLARDPAMVHAFLAATQAAVRMVHKNIASTFDFGGKMTLPWAAREHLFGVGLLELIEQVAAERVPIPWRLATYLVAEAAEGVAALRARLPGYGPPMGFLTGAVAPSVFLTEEGEVKLVDACLSLVDGLPLIDSRALPYRPSGPMPAGPNTGRADAFGLAVILWELVAGRRLFAGQDDDETVRLVDASVVPTLRGASLPPFLDELVQRAFGKSSAHPGGFASAAEVAEALRAGLATAKGEVGPSDVRAVVSQAFAGVLTDQRARLADAWLREQALQEQGDLPPDLTSDAELTRPNHETVRETTTETALSRRGGFGDGFDDVPTVPRNRVAPPSWRPEAAAPRIEYLPETPPPPSTQPSLARAAAQAAAGGSRTERPPLVMPPVERPMIPLAGERSAAPLPQRPRRALFDTTSPYVVAGIGVGLAVALLVAVVRHHEGTTEPTAVATPTVFASDPPRVAPSPPVPHPGGSWTPLPTGSIPVSSSDDLPRAPDTTPEPGVLSHRVARPPRLSGRTGLLTVFCTPACDDVLDGARPLGPSPVFKAPASVGEHRLRLRVASVEKTVRVLVRENETSVVRESVGE